MQVQDNGKSIELRAYELWERAGRPEGRALEHWLQAESECAGQKPARPRARRATTAASDATPRARRTTKVTPILMGKASAPK
jgi:hypothetical protein